MHNFRTNASYINAFRGAAEMSGINHRHGHTKLFHLQSQSIRERLDSILRHGVCRSKWKHHQPFNRRDINHSTCMQKSEASLFCNNTAYKRQIHRNRADIRRTTELNLCNPYNYIDYNSFTNP